MRLCWGAVTGGTVHTLQSCKTYQWWQSRHKTSLDQRGSLDVMNDQNVLTLNEMNQLDHVSDCSYLSLLFSPGHEITAGAVEQFWDLLLMLPGNCSAIPGTLIFGLFYPGNCRCHYTWPVWCFQVCVPRKLLGAWMVVAGQGAVLHLSDFSQLCLGRSKQLLHALWFFWGALHSPSSLSLG